MTTNPLAHTPIKLSLNAEDFYTWVNVAKPGERLEYHRGVLASDKGKCGNAELSRLARRAQHFADLGNVILVQRRYGVDDYGYIAIRRKRKWS